MFEAFQKLSCMLAGILLIFSNAATSSFAQESETSLKQKFRANLAKAQQGDANAQNSVAYAYEFGEALSNNSYFLCVEASVMDKINFFAER